MSVNYAQKYAQKIDERFTLDSLTAAGVNDDYDFVGVKTVNVYSIPTASMNDYLRSGTARYGTPAELDNTIQEMKLTNDRAFTFTIDRGNFDDTMMANTAGAALKRQISEVVIPEIDAYRLAVMAENAGTVKEGTISSSNAYDEFLSAEMALSEGKVPINGRVAFVSPTFYKAIKLDSSFVRNGDMSQKMLVTGQVGTVDGVSLVLVPSSYLPDGVELIVTTKSATTAPVKLSDYKIHDNPPGINGWLVEGRVYYDAFVLNKKACGIYVFKTV